MIPGGWELIVIVGVLVLLFGASRLPVMARSIGQSARVFKGEMKGLKDDEAKAAEQKADKNADEPQPAALPKAADTPINGQSPAKATQPPTGAGEQ